MRSIPTSESASLPGKSGRFGAGFNKFYSGRKASVLAAVKALDDRASTSEGGVRVLRGYVFSFA